MEDELQCGGIAINREVNTQSTEVENGQTLGWVEGGGRSHHSTVEDVTSTVWGRTMCIGHSTLLQTTLD